MRVDNWDTKLSNYIVEQSKTKFVRGKTDCVNFILGGIEVIIGRKVFDREYKSLKEAKKILKDSFVQYVLAIA